MFWQDNIFLVCACLYGLFWVVITREVMSWMVAHLGISVTILTVTSSGRPASMRFSFSLLRRTSSVFSMEVVEPAESWFPSSDFPLLWRLLLPTSSFNSDNRIQTLQVKQVAFWRTCLKGIPLIKAGVVRRENSYRQTIFLRLKH